ncbi:gliding motility-associated C-terminal domain-containing protein [Tenacibaculum tangerinum]|uniref:Gliding motility-associated C-terminal domain-containing protein n=1 Tax=Tenacibaculum tangerinum TaxID=3038772 RepID=A0ABY8L2I4_9FLAO|nr:gliding motility-associated C-terminal domain-containing protein [Tenacibaculum tangerinum]WGH75580.1 gliding motility-associated C-terminal domain-containing protein [Tenacibaculum tangerinum]
MTSSDADNTICLGESVTFTASGGDEYEFYVGGMIAQVQSTTATYTTTGLADGQEVTVRVINTTTGCEATSAGITTTVNALPTAGLTSSDADNTICLGESVTFTASGGDEYEFYVGGMIAQAQSTTATYTTTGLADGQEVTVRVINTTTGCEATSAGITTTVNALPTAGLTSSDADNTICLGESVTFTASGGDEYEFYVGGMIAQVQSTTATYTTTGLADGQEVTVRVINTTTGCEATSAGITTTVNALPTAGLTSSDADNTICLGESVTFTASGGDEYEFYLGGMIAQVQSTTATYTTTGLADGQEVTVRVINTTTGCEATSAGITTTVNALPTAGLTSSDADNTICLGESVTFTASGGDEYEFYVGGMIAQVQSTTATYTTTGLADGQEVTVRVINTTTGCEATSAGITTTVNALPTAGLTSSDADNTICLGESVTFTASGGDEYEFYVGGMIAQVQSTTATYTTTGLADGQEVTVRVINTTTGCEATSAGITTTVNALPTAGLTSSDADNTICLGESVTFTASGGDEYEFYVGGMIAQVQSTTATYTTTGLADGQEVTVRVINTTTGCEATSAGITTTVNALPTAGLTSSDADNTICLGESVTFTASGGDEYEFYLGGMIAQVQSTTATYTTTGLADGQEVTVRVINTTTGCEATSAGITTTVNALPTAGLTSSDADNTICLGESVTFTASGGDEYEFYVGGMIAQVQSTTATYTTTGLADGQEVTVRVINTTTGCEATSAGITTTVNALPTAGLTSSDADNTICLGESVTFTASGGDEYEFYVGGMIAQVQSTTATYTTTGLADGQEVTVRVINTTTGCEATSAGITTTVNALPTAGLTSSDADNTICLGESVTFTASGGDEYEFYVGGMIAQAQSTTATYTTTGLADGQEVTVRVINTTTGCEATSAGITTTVNALPTAGLTSSDADNTICLGESVTFTASGGDEYEFYVGGMIAQAQSTTATYTTTGLADGQEVTVRVINTTTGCEATSAGITTTVNALPTAGLTSSDADNTICLGESVTFTASGGDEYEFYVGGMIAQAQSTTATYTTTGLADGQEVTVRVINTTTGCEATSAGITTTVNALPTAGLTSSDADNTICLGESVTFTASGGDEYEFYVGGMIAQAQSTTATYTTTGLADGQEVTVRVINTTTGCEATSAGITTTVNALPTAGLTSSDADNTICLGESVTFTASGGDEYEFYVGGMIAQAQSTTATYTTTGLADGQEVTVRVINTTTGCEATSAGITTTVNALPTAGLTSSDADNTICLGESVTFTASGGDEYEFYVGGMIAQAQSTTATYTTTGLADGQEVTVRVINTTTGCEATSAGITTTVNALPTAGLTSSDADNTICLGESVTFTASGGDEYEFYVGGMIAQAQSTTATYTTTGLADGQEVTVRVINTTTGCEATSAGITTTVNALPTAGLTSSDADNTICLGESVTFTASGGDEYEFYVGGMIAQAQSTTATYTTTGLADGQEVTVRVINTTTGCEATSAGITTTVNALPTAGLTSSDADNTICLGESVTFTASGGDEYEFYVGGMIAQAQSTTATYTTTGLADGQEVTVRVINTTTGCEATSAGITTTVNALPTAGLTSSDADNTICLGESVTFTASGGDEYEFYVGGMIAQAQSTTATYTTTGLADGQEVTVRVINTTTGCEATSAGITTTVNALPTAGLTSSDADNTICLGESVTFTASGGDEYEFYVGGMIAQAQSTTATYTTTGLADGQEVTVRVINTTTGCEATSAGITTTVNALPTAGLTSSDADNTICLGESVTFTASGGDEYEFYLGGMIAQVQSTTATYTTTGLADGQEVTVRVINTTTGCEATSAGITTTVNALPTAGLTSSDADNTICLGESVTFTASGGDEYEFYVGGMIAQAQSTTATYTTTGLADGQEVTVRVINTTTGCEATSAGITTTVNALPTAGLTSSDADNTICLGESVTFTASGGDEYEFYVGGMIAQAQSTTATYTTTGLADGQEVTVRVINTTTGCEATSAGITTTVNALPTAGLTSSDADNTICLGESVTFTASGGDEYEFYVGGMIAQAQSTTATYTTTGLADGQEVTVRVINTTTGCEATSAGITTTVNALPTAGLTSSDADNTICLGESVTFTASGGDEYEFYVGGMIAQVQSTTATYTTTGLADGQEVTVRVINTTTGCEATSAGITTTVNALPTAGLTSSDADNTICLGESVTFTASGGDEYEFYVGGMIAQAQSTTATYTTTGLADGQEVTVRVINTTTGCEATSAGITTTVNALPTAGLTSSDADNTICLGESVIFTASGGDEYEFYVGGMIAQVQSTTATYTTTGLADGQEVTVRVINTTTGCEATSAGITTTVNALPTAGLTSSDADNTICLGESVTFTASGGDEYEFYVGGMIAQAQSTTATYTTTGLADGQEVTVRVINTTTGCEATSAGITTTVNALPTAGLTSSDADNTICLGESVTFTASGGDEYEFYVGGMIAQVQSTTATYTTTGLADGQEVTVRVINTTTGCEATSAGITTTVNALPTAGLTSSDADNTICLGESVTFTASGGDEYEFYVGGMIAQAQSTTATYTTTGLADGQEVTVRVINTTTGCEATSAGITTTVNALPTAGLTSSDADNTICLGESVTFTASGGDEYEFYVGGMIAQAQSTTATYTTTGLADGQEVTVRVINTTTGCEATSAGITTTVNALPTAGLTSSDADNTICLGESVTFTASGGDEYEFYVGGMIAQAQSTTATYTTTGLADGQEVTVRVINTTTGCEATSAGITTTVNALPTAGLTSSDADNTICLGESVTFTASGGDEYEFYVGGMIAQAQSTTATYTTTGLADGQEVTVRVINTTTGCEATSAGITTTVNALPTAGLTSSDADNTICLGESVTFTASGGDEYEFYLGGMIAQVQSTTATYTTTGLADGQEVTVRVINTTTGCEATSAGITTTVNALPTAGLTSSDADNTICLGESVTFTASGGDEYEFYVGGMIAQAQSTTATYTTTGLADGQEVTVRVINTTTGCEATSAGITTTVNALPTAGLTSSDADNTICLGESVTFTASGGDEYEFYVGGMIAQVQSTTATYTTTGLADGQEVTVRVINTTTGCEATSAGITTTVNALPTAGLTSSDADNTICLGESVTFTASGGDEYEFYVGGMIAQAQSTTATYTTTGLADGQEVTVRVINTTTGCEATSAGITTTVNALPTAGLTSSDADNTICLGESVTFTASGGDEYEFYVGGMIAQVQSTTATYTTTGLADGQEVTVRVINTTTGCEATSAGITTTVNALPTAGLTSSDADNTICLGESVTFTASGGDEYEFYVGGMIAQVQSTTATYTTTGLADGQEVTVRVINTTTGCEATSAGITTTVNALPTAGLTSSDADNTICLGESVTFTASGGDEYEFYVGGMIAQVQSTTATYTTTGLADGQEVTVRVINTTTGCEATSAGITTTVNALPTAGLTSSDADNTICLGESVTFTASGGDEYEFYVGGMIAQAQSTTATYTTTGLADGQEVTVRVINTTTGCEATSAGITTTVNALPTAGLTSSDADNTICLGESVTFTASGGDEYEFYVGGMIAQAQSTTATYTTTGLADGQEVTVRVINTTTGCEATSAGITTTVNALPTAGLTSSDADNTICLGESVTFTASGGDEYEFYVGGMIAQAQSTTATYTTTGLADGQEVTVRVINTTTGCEATSAGITTTVNALPTAGLTSSDADNTICLGESVTFTASGGDEYEFYVGGMIAQVQSTTATYTTTGLADGQEVTVRVINTTTGCEATSAGITTTVNALPTAGLTSSDADNTICLGESVTFTASGGDEYEFYVGGMIAQVQSTTATYTTTGLADGQEVTVRVINTTTGCEATSAGITTTVNALPTAGLTSSDADNTICLGESVTFTASGGDEYEFYVGGMIAQAQSTTATYTTTGLADGQEVTVRVINTTTGCEATSAGITTTVNALPTAGLTSSDADNTICLGESVTFTASGGDEYEFYVGGMIAQVQSTTATYTTTGLADGQEVTVRVINTTTGCEATSAGITTTVNALPTAGLTSSDADNTICLGESVTFTASGGDEYEFYVGGMIAQVQSTTATYTTTGLADGQEVTVRVINTTTGCEATSAGITTTVNALPTAGLTSSDADNTICLGESVTFTASGGDEYEFYVGGMIAQVQSTTATYTTTGLADGQEVTVRVINTTTGCEATSAGITTTVNALPTAGLTSSDADNTICLGESVTFTASGGDEYEFYVGGMIAQVQSTTATYTTTGLADGQEVTVRVINTTTGCEATSAGITTTVNALPTAGLTSSDADNTICLGESVTFTASGGDEYEFYVGGMIAQVQSTTATYTTTGLADGQEVTVRVINTTTGCEATSAGITTTVNALPTAGLTSSDADNTICLGESVTFTASGGDEYEFYLGGMIAQVQSTTATYTTTGLADGQEVTVRVINTTTGCEATSAGITTTVNALPTAGLTSSDADNTICLGESVTFTASGGDEYEFYVGGMIAQAQSTTATYTTTGLADGQEVTVRVINTTTGCEATSAGITTTVNALPTAGLTSSDADNTICLGESVTFTASGGDEYEFYLGGMIAQVQSTTATYTTTGLADGQEVTVRVINTTTGCEATSAGITTTVNALPTAGLTSSDADNTICLGESVTFTASGGDEYEFYVDGMIAQVQSTTATYTTTGLADGQEVTVRVINTTTGCEATSAGITTTVNALPTAGLTSSDADNTICLGESVTFTASGGDEYEFYVGGMIAQVQSTTATYTTTGLADGQEVTVRVINTTTGCEATSAGITTTVNALPTAGLTSSDADNTICLGESVTFTASGGDEYEFYVGGMIAQVQSTTATYTTTGLADGQEVTVRVINTTTGCEATSTGIIMNVNVGPDTDNDGISDDCDPDDDNDGNPDGTDSNPLVPTVADDVLVVVEGTTGTVNVLANDDFIPGPDTSLTQVGGTAGGTVTFDPLTGEMSYVPATGEEGTTVTVTYQVCNTAVSPQVCETATVTITVQIDTDGDGTPDDIDVDSDNDGISDTVEGTGDTDNDGIPDYLDLDSDNDGILDVDEGGNGHLDTNGDGVIDANDDGFTDADNNGQDDDSEAIDATDTDGDNVPDYLDLDSDNDGINDVIEDGNAAADTNGDGIIDANDTNGGDSDGDGISDSIDADDNGFGEGASGEDDNTDTDGDGVPDYQDLDSDNDGVNDVIEGGNPDENGDGIIDNPYDDADGDGIADSVDGLDGHGDANDPDYDTDPTDPNSGGNGIVRDSEIDTDGDGIPDSVDGLVGFGDNDLDTDGDGILDYIDADSDNDGIPDTVEGTGDTDNDGIPDYLDLDSDNDGILDVDEGGNGHLDTNGDGVIDINDEGFTDVDNDGQDDDSEAIDAPDTDGDNVPDYQDLDSDNDGINDVIEDGNAAADTNGDGVIDTNDTNGGDSDGDGISDSVDADDNGFGEGASGEDDNTDTDGDGIPDYLDLDSDNDGINDVVEGGNADEDEDGLVDNPYDDADGDGIADSVDGLDGHGDANDPDKDSDPTDPNSGGSGLVTDSEIDTDGDGIPDSVDGLDGFGDGPHDDTCVKVNNLISPNGDSANAYLHIDCIENFPDNAIEIFNRWGNTVYKARGYNNTNIVFRGISQGRASINVDDKLPVGTYFYILELGNGGKVKKGWIYINR